MNLEYVNRSGMAIPRAYLQSWLGRLATRLRKKKILSVKEARQTLFVAFIGSDEMTSLNQRYRKKNRPTDVLSFESDDPELIGELVICPQVIRTQAKEHGLSQREELAYMLTHGLLHLLGYEHEQGEEDARIMFELQDSLFDELRKSC